MFDRTIKMELNGHIGQNVHPSCSHIKQACRLETVDYSMYNSFPSGLKQVFVLTVSPTQPPAVLV